MWSFLAAAALLALLSGERMLATPCALQWPQAGEALQLLIHPRPLPPRQPRKSPLKRVLKVSTSSLLAPRSQRTPRTPSGLPLDPPGSGGHLVEVGLLAEDLDLAPWHHLVDDVVPDPAGQSRFTSLAITWVKPRRNIEAPVPRRAITFPRPPPFQRVCTHSFRRLQSLHPGLQRHQESLR
jgi:hypothetical protein